MTGRETRESPFGMKVPLVPERSSEIVAYCPLKEQVPDVSIVVMDEMVRLL